MPRFRIAFLSLLPIAVGMASCSSTGSTYSGGTYEKLKAENYATSAITKNAAGQRGWQVSNGEKTYFCKMAATKALDGQDGLVIFSSSGRMLPADKDVYMTSVGIKEVDAPQWSDLEAGRPRSQDVGACRLI